MATYSATPQKRCYIVAWEPVEPFAAQTIKDRLKATGFFCPINNNCWATVTTMTAPQLRDHLTDGIPQTKIIVIRSGTEAAWRHSPGEKNDAWLKEWL